MYKPMTMDVNCKQLRRIPDYALGLVQGKEGRRVAHHLASCIACRQALQAERRTEHEVRNLLRQLPRPDNRRLRTLMPPVPPAAHPRRMAWLRGQLAPAVALLAIVVSSWFWRSSYVEPLSSAASTPALRGVVVSGAPKAIAVQFTVEDDEGALFTVPAAKPVVQDVTMTPAPRPPLGGLP